MSEPKWFECSKCLDENIDRLAHHTPESILVDYKTYKRYQEYYRLKELADRPVDESWTERHWQSANQDFLNFKIENGYEEYPENDQEE